MATEAPAVAAIIVNWNSRDDVIAAVDSLRAQEGVPVEIWVVDNGSEDGSVEAIRGRHPDAHVIEAGENLGFAEGCNRGIARTRAEWIFLLNNDAVAQPGCLSLLLAAARSVPRDVGMLQPCLVFTSDPDRVNSSGVVVFRNGVPRDRHFGEPVDAALEPGEIFCTTAGAALYRRSMLEQVRTSSGYFDRNFFMYFEDVDLGWRCRLAGWRALYVPEARVTHRFQASSARRGRRFADVRCRVNRVNLLVKNASVPMLVRATPRTIKDVWTLLFAEPTALAQLARRLPVSLRERGEVRRLLAAPRRSVERRWMTKPPR